MVPPATPAGITLEELSRQSNPELVYNYLYNITETQAPVQCPNTNTAPLASTSSFFTGVQLASSASAYASSASVSASSSASTPSITVSSETHFQPISELEQEREREHVDFASESVDSGRNSAQQPSPPQSPITTADFAAIW